MSGVAGGNRIQKENVKATFDKYVREVLKKIPGFKKAELSGSVKVGTKADYGDLDLVTLFEGEDKKEVKQRIINLATSLPDNVIVPFKSEKYSGRKYYNSGEIISILYPIVGKEDEYIQIDNIIALTEEEHKFKGGFLDLPAEKQGLILGLVKVILLEEPSDQVFKRMGIKGLPPLGENEEYEFNLSSNKLTLRKVKLDNFKEVSRQEIWYSTNWNDIKKLLEKFDTEGSFDELLVDVMNKLKNPRSKNRVKGIFKSMISVKSGEVGTPKGDNKEKALAKVGSLLEQDNEREKTTIAVYGGGFKPPHLGHFNNAKLLADQSDKLVIFIGKKVREGIAITPEMSRKIWEIYKKYLNNPNEIDIRISPISPVRDVYEYAEERKNDGVKIITGGIAEELGQKFDRLEKDPEKYGDVEVITFAKTGIEDTVDSELDKLSATSIRSSKEYLTKGDWLPKVLSKEDKKAVIDIILTSNAEDDLDKTLEELFGISQKKQPLKENSSGTPIAPQPVQRSEDRGKLVRVYEQLRNTLGDKFYNIEFKNDHVAVYLKEKSRAPGFDYTPYMASILEYMMDSGMKITPLPEVKIKKDLVEAEDFFGKTAYYNPVQKEIVLYTQNRHPKDVMRSFAHEMIHHKQNLEGRLNSIGTTNTNEDDYLLEIEKEAYLEGNITFRNWEDQIKKKTLNEVMAEGRYDKISNQISSDLFKALKAGKKTFFGNYYNGDLDFQVHGDFIPDNKEKYFFVDGDSDYDETGEDNDSIRVIVSYNPKELPNAFSDIAFTLKDVVRHEIEHLTHGDSDNLKTGKYMQDDSTIRALIKLGHLPKGDYFKLEKEVDANIQGMYFRAKKEKRPFKDVVKQYFDDQNIPKEDYEHILNLMNKRLPALGIKQRL